MKRGRSTDLLVQMSMALAAAAALTASGAGEEGVHVSHRLVGGPQSYIVQPGDSLTSLGARHGIVPSTLARQNGLKPTAQLQAGSPITLDNLHIVPSRPGAALVVNVPQRMLFFDAGDEAVVGYPIAVGRPDWPTPLGDFTIVAKEEQPTWDVPLSIQREARSKGQPVIKTMPPCPENPLGEYWLALSLPAIGIHGTVAPLSIHRAVTHGCIRLHPDDIRALFPQVRVGQPGSIVYEPVLLAEVEGRIYLEVHADVYRMRRRDARAELGRAADATGWTACIDWGVAEDALARREGVARLVGNCGRHGGAP